MLSGRRALALLSILHTVTSYVLPRLERCADAWYDPDQYTCFDEEVLCPITNNVPYFRCGDACYDRFQYDCGKAVVPRRRAGSIPFTMMAFDPVIFNQPANPPIEACEGKFWIAEEGGWTCTTCHAQPDCTLGNDTVMFDGGRMNTAEDVPQRAYIAPDGALSFTTLLDVGPTFQMDGPHNLSDVPAGSMLDLQAYHHGYLQAPPGTLGWRACPIDPFHVNHTPKVISAQGRYQVYAALPDVGINVDCFEITILTSDWNHEGPAAWAYV